jgi:apolipoprotein N-acyltransferase
VAASRAELGPAPTALTRLLARPAWVAALAGGLVATTLPPLGFLPGLLGWPLLLAALRRRPGAAKAFRLGLVFAFVLAALGLWWVTIAFLTDVRRYGAIAAPAVVLLCLAVALTQAIPIALVGLRSWRSITAHALALAVALSVAEWFKGEVLGFPWNPVAVAWTATDATMQPLAWLGGAGYGLLTLALLLPLAALVEPEASDARRGAVLASAALLLLAIGAGSLRLASVPSEPMTPPVAVRVVQGNVAQHHKWDPARLRDWFIRHLELTARPAATPPSVVVWPESAIPFSVEEDREVQAALRRVLPPGAVLLTGAERVDRTAEPIRISNALYAIGADGLPLAHYDKHDLVPFGEFLPFRHLLGRLGLGSMVGGSIDFTAGPGRQTLQVSGLPGFSPLICYEAVFPSRATDGSGAARWLVNVTNDAWYGRSSGPYQHLAMARMRAVEEGLPLVRAANTGISVVTDAAGRVTARLSLGETGVLDALLPAALADRPWASRFGVLIHLAGLLGAAILALVLERRA